MKAEREGSSTKGWAKLTVKQSKVGNRKAVGAKVSKKHQARSQSKNRLGSKAVEGNEGFEHMNKTSRHKAR